MSASMRSVARAAGAVPPPPPPPPPPLGARGVGVGVFFTVLGGGGACASTVQGPESAPSRHSAVRADRPASMQERNVLDIARDLLRECNGCGSHGCGYSPPPISRQASPFWIGRAAYSWRLGSCGCCTMTLANRPSPSQVQFSWAPLTLTGTWPPAGIVNLKSSQNWLL